MWLGVHGGCNTPNFRIGSGLKFSNRSSDFRTERGWRIWITSWNIGRIVIKCRIVALESVWFRKAGYAISVWVLYARKVYDFGYRNFKRTSIVSIPLPLDSFFRDEQLSCWALFEICPRRASKWQISEMTPEIGPFCNFRKLLYIRHKFALFTNWAKQK